MTPADKQAIARVRDIAVLAAKRGRLAYVEPDDLCTLLALVREPVASVEGAADRCPRCDRPTCNHFRNRDAKAHRGALEVAQLEDCIDHEVDWRARALSLSPPPAVLDAAREVLRLAEGATKGPWSEVVWYGTDEGGWAAVGPHHTGADDECDDDASDNHARAEADAAFIAACRTLAPLLAEFVKGGDK